LVLLLRLALLAAGLRDLVPALPGGEHRVASALSGASAVVSGVVALSWRDVTVFAIGALFGCWLLVLGILVIAAAIRDRRGSAAGAVRVPGWLRIAGGAVAFLAAIAVAVAAVRLSSHPVPDAFYAAPDEVPAEPG